MDIVYESKLKELLSGNRILPVYVLFGDDGYLINHYMNMIINKTCGKDNDFDLQKFEKDADLQGVYDALNQFPMMSDRKCIILSDYDFEAASADNFEKLITLLSDDYEFSTFVFMLEDFEPDFKRSSKAKKILAAVEQGGGLVVELKHRDDNDLARMLVNGAKKRDYNLDISTAKYMVEICGSDINTLISELDKVCRYVESNEIDKADIDKVCVKSVEASVYEYVKAVIDCNASLAFKILDDLLFMRFEPMIIVYTLASSLTDIVRVSVAKKANKATSDVVSDFAYKNKSFLVSRANTNLRKFDDNRIRLCIKEILKADNLLKSSAADKKTLLEQMTVRVIYIIANGDIIDNT